MDIKEGSEDTLHYDSGSAGISDSPRKLITSIPWKKRMIIEGEGDIIMIIIIKHDASDP
jgi:hypothetical protein